MTLRGSNGRRTLALTLGIVCAVAACTRLDRNTVGGYTPGQLAVVAKEAREECAARRGPGRVPPNEFTTDGCSLFPDGQWRHCCVSHDKTYWCGGSSAERLEADDVFGACVAEASSPVLGRIARLGVRAGGAPWVPFWFRWGYGWPWPAPYDDAKP